MMAMLCRKCSVEFIPTEEEERLIEKGDLAPICEDCAPAPVVKPKYIEQEEKKRLVLWRVERTNVAGEIIAVMRVPKKIKIPTVTPLRKPRADHLHVFVMSEGSTQKKSSSPRTILHTNLETFRKDKRPFWVSKIPAFWDGQTGVPRIEVQLADVVEITEEDDITRVRCKDGSEVHLFYRGS